MARFEPVTKTEKTDNCSVNVCFLSDKLYAMTETNHIRQIDCETLETIGGKVEHFENSFCMKILFYSRLLSIS